VYAQPCRQDRYAVPAYAAGGNSATSSDKIARFAGREAPGSVVT
jgi:hypothetical protein